MDDNIKIPTIPKLKLGKINISEADIFQPADIIEHIKQARIEATKRGIKANMVAISDKLYFSKLQEMCLDVPMVCGLKCVYTNELPNDTIFAVLEAPNAPMTKDERIKELEDEIAKLMEKMHMIYDLVT